MKLIECKNLYLGYEDGAIIENLSFFAEVGDYLCIVGENGSGKSTLVKTLLGLITPLKGSIEYSKGLNSKEIGYLPQQSAIQRDFPSSVMEVVISGCLNRHKGLFGYTKAEKSRAMESLIKLGMESRAKDSYQDLSGGQQQRVLLARALMATEKLVLLDEPVTGLDPKAASDLYAIIRKLNEEGITVLMVTHDIHPALNDAKTILHLSQESYFFGNKEEYFASELGKRFLKEAGHHEHH